MPGNETQPSEGPPDGVRPFTIDFTVYYAVQGPEHPAQNPPAVLLALHGWGQNCRRFLRDFEPLRTRNVLVVAPQAPHQFYLDMIAKKVGFNWLTVYDRPQAIADANRYLARLLEHVRQEHPCDPERLYVLGFSQGSAMAWRFALSGAARVSGVISCCSDLPPDVAEQLHGARPFSVLVAHGEEDTLVSEDKIDAMREGLEASGHPFTDIRFEGSHELPPDLIETIGDWIEQS